MNRHALEINGVSKGYGTQTVLSHIDLAVEQGTLTAVLGPSGSGKTTLLRLIVGFDMVDSGTITAAGTVVSGSHVHVPTERRSIGFVAQEGGLFPSIDVAGNVGFALPRGRRAARVTELLELVGLAGLGRRMPHELSGGEQQRVALARALAANPTTVLLDEPFSALDPALRSSLRTDVQHALRETNTTALLVTHDQTEALSFADQVAVIRNGQLVQTADPSTLYREPVDAELAQFLGDANLIPATIDNGQLHCLFGRVKLRREQPGGQALVMIRPEQLVLDTDAAGPTGRVTAVSYYGHDAAVDLEVIDHNETATTVVARTAGHNLPAIGQLVTIAIEGDVVAYPQRPQTTCRPQASRTTPSVSPARTTVG